MSVRHSEGGEMKAVWVLKETVLRAGDEHALQRQLHSLESALRRRDGSIVDVERAPALPSERHVAVIRYEIPLTALERVERRQLQR